MIIIKMISDSDLLATVATEVHIMKQMCGWSKWEREKAVEIDGWAEEKH